jgi:hypothetical protein
MKVGDLVQLSSYGKKKSYYPIRSAKYGVILGIIDDQMIMRDNSYKDVVAYRVRWFDKQGNPIDHIKHFQRIMLKFLNKKKRSNV